MDKMQLDALKAEIASALGSSIVEARPLGVGFGLSGLEARLADGRKLAVKAASDARAGNSHLPLEAYMLRELARLSELPVPQVLYANERLLVMSWIENDGGSIGTGVQRHAAELLAVLHGAPYPSFGFERDTVIGPLKQPNPRSQQWLPFFRDHRLMHMARLAHEEGRLNAATLNRLDNLAARLEDYLIEPAHASLIHGDLWTGNVLVSGHGIAGFVDPAIYCADREIELAFTTMFGTFGPAFFDAYETLLPLEPGFHDIRCGIYNLYPVLVHVRLFGASYLGQVTATLDRLGI